MNVIKIKIDFEKGLCQKEGISVVTGDYNSTKIEFEFNESAADGRKIFELKNSDDELVYVDEIVNNEVILVGKREEEGEEKLFSLFNKEGDYTFEVSLYGENSKLTSVYDYITARKEQVIVDDETVEQYMPLFDNLMQELSNKVAEADSKIDEIDQAIEEANQAVQDAEEAVESTNNLNIDVNKVDKTTQVDLTKKDGTTKTVYINDGTSLQFMWQGTSLGIKTDDMQDYVFVDLQGIQGQPGPQGEPFRIKKTYISVAEMNADFDNMNVGDYVMIASTVEIEDNAKLYVKGDSQWIFITDFSGATGIKGETGATPIIRIGTVTSGSTPSVTISGTAEEPVFNFVLQPGEKGLKGDTGATGPTGNGIASVTKTASAGLIDTYTITFTDGTTTTFNITNGQDGEVTQEYVDEENERLKSIFNVLPKVSDSGESVELENTGDTMLYKMDLKGNTSQEVIQGEVGLEEKDTSIYVDDVNESKEDYITLKGNTYQETTTGKNLIYIEPRIASGITPSYDKKTGKISISGTPTSEWISLEAKHNLSIPAGTYTLSLKDSLPFRIIIRFYTDSTNYDEMSIYANNKETTKTFSNNIVATQMWVQLSTSTTYNTNFYIQLEQGSTATSYEPYTNGASPNPDYPQEIEVVTGLNEVKVEGKNLFNKNSGIDYGKFYTSTGDVGTDSDLFLQTIYIPVNSSTQYTFSGSYTDYFRICEYDKDKNFIQRDLSDNTTTSFTITTTAQTKYVRISCFNRNLSSLQLEQSSTATTYEAYKGQTYEIDLRTSKNIFDITKILKNKDLKKDTGQVRDTTGWYASDWIAIKPNTAYTSSNISSDTKCWYDKNKTFISYANTTTATSPANAKYLRVNGTLASIESNPNLMIEEGESQTTYEPYTSIELCKIGTYQDRIYKNNGNWYLHKEIGKYVCNSTRTNAVNDYMSGTNEVSKNGTYSLFLNDTSSDISNNTMYFSVAKYEYNSIITGNIDAQNNLSDNSFCMRQGTNDRIYFKNSAFTGKTGEEISPLLNGKTLFYVLITPTDTQITDTTLISQLNALYNATIYSTTHINTETSNLLPYINLKYNVVTASPSPDRASEVEVVKGNNTITISNEDGTKTQTYNITLGNLELCKIGDYQDYFYKDNGNWYKYGAIGKVVLDGSESDWTLSPSGNLNRYLHQLTNPVTSTTCMSDYFTSIPYLNAQDYGCYIGASGKVALFYNAITSVNDFKNWLSNNNTIIYYPLATPTQTQITDQLLVSQLDELQKAMSYYDKTLITQTNADKPFIIDAIGIRDLQDIFNLISGE